MVKCKCGAYFLVAYFDGVCPQCGKEYHVPEEAKRMRRIADEVCKRINQGEMKDG